MEEIFKTITEFENYEISNLGRIRNKKNNKIIAQYKKGGRGKIYSDLVSIKDDKKKKTTVHLLVANEFLLKVEGMDLVKHIDGNFDNNNVNNLEWFSNKLPDDVKKEKSKERADLTKEKDLFCIHKNYIKWSLDYEAEFLKYQQEKDSIPKKPIVITKQFKAIGFHEQEEINKLNAVNVKKQLPFKEHQELIKKRVCQIYGKLIKIPKGNGRFEVRREKYEELPNDWLKRKNVEY